MSARKISKWQRVSAHNGRVEKRCFDIDVENTNLRQFEKLYNEALKKIADLEFQISTNEIMVLEATKLESSWQRAQAEIERYRPMENSYKEAEAVRKTLSEKLGLGHTATWPYFHGVMSQCFDLSKKARDLFGLLKDLRL